MAHTVILPKQGLQMTEGLISKWLVSEGETVTAGEPLFEMETDKLTITIDAQVDGTLLKIIHPAGDTVEITKPIALIGDADEQTDTQEEAPTNVPTEVETLSQPAVVSTYPLKTDQKTTKTLSTPLARRRAQELRLDISKIKSSRPLGVVIERDVLGAREAVSTQGHTASVGTQNSHTVLTCLDEIQKLQQIMNSHGVDIGYGDFISYAATQVLKRFERLCCGCAKVAVFSDGNATAFKLDEISSLRMLTSARQTQQSSEKDEDVALFIYDLTNTDVDSSFICTGGLSLSIGSPHRGVRVDAEDRVTGADMLYLTVCYDPQQYDVFECADFLSEIACMLKEPISILC